MRNHPFSPRSLVALTATLLTLTASTSWAAVVTLPYKGSRQIEELNARGIEILAHTKYGIDVQAEGANLRWLTTRPYPVNVSEEPLHSTAVIDANLGIYHTYAETESVLTYLQTTYPTIAKRIVLGTSLEGRNITALKVSDNVASDESEAEVLFMGNHHARELMSVEIPLRFAQYLLSKYGINSELTGYINNREIWFVPMVNPDGHYYVQQNHAGSSNNWWRKNRRNNGNGTFGVDLNRNYGYEWGFDNIGSSPTPSSATYRGTGAFSEPETQVIRDFVNTREFTTWLSYHSYGELLLFGWGYVAQNTPDHDIYDALGDSLALGTGYLVGNAASGAIYITNGDADDWAYGEQVTKPKIYGFTPEVNSAAQGGFGPAETWIQPTFDLLRPMNVRLLKFADNPEGVVGPFAPVQSPVQAPYSNGINRVSWTGTVPLDPNPAVSYDVESCLNPSTFIDACTPLMTGWTTNGFLYSGSGGLVGAGYTSNTGNGIFHTLTMTRPFIVDAAHDSLRFNVTWDIEQDYDWGYVDVSTNGGGTWTPIQGNITTTFNPFGTNRGHGFTGTSPGWANAIFPLTAFLGQTVMVRFAYATDGAIAEPGFRIDNINPVVMCTSSSIVATALTDTEYDHVPPSAGVWEYRVRARDAENQFSRWSNSQSRLVSTITDAGTPRVYQTDLGANYPNPFNPSTRIPFVVGGAPGTRAVAVELAIFSVTGERVATLVRENRAPGTYLEPWNGRGSSGAAVPTGVYFARLVVDGAVSHVRKLVLLK